LNSKYENLSGKEKPITATESNVMNFSKRNLGLTYRKKEVYLNLFV